MKRACTLEKAGMESSRRMPVSQPKERVLARGDTVAPFEEAPACPNAHIENSINRARNEKTSSIQFQLLNLQHSYLASACSDSLSVNSTKVEI